MLCAGGASLGGILAFAVANAHPGDYAGILPWDATMISMALLREHPLPRYPRFLVLNWAFDLPWISAFIRRVGGVVASPYNAMRLLERHPEVVLRLDEAASTGPRAGGQLAAEQGGPFPHADDALAALGAVAGVARAATVVGDPQPQEGGKCSTE